MPKTLTHNAITMRPPPGTRFTIWGQDVELQFERGKEKEVYDWLMSWFECYVAPELQRAMTPPERETIPEVEESPKVLCGVQDPKGECVCSLVMGHTGYHAAVLIDENGKAEVVAGWPMGDNAHVEEE